MPRTKNSCIRKTNFTLNMSQKEELIHAISFGRKILWICGLYHCKHLEKHFAYNYTRIIVILLSIPCPTLIIGDLLQSNCDLAQCLEPGMYFLGSLWCFIEMLVQIYCLKHVAVLEDMLESDYEYFRPRTELQSQFLSAKNMRLSYISKTVICCFYSFAFILILCPLLTNQSLTVAMWMPFNDQERAAYIYQSIYLLVISCVYPLLHNTFLGPILMATAQFQILKDNLLHSTDRSEEEDAFTQEKRIQNRLKRCIIHHNAILRFVAKVESLLAPVFLGNISFTTLGICCTLLQIIMTAEGSDLILLMSYMVFLTGQMFLTCWVGNDLITESSNITEACYMSDWYTCSTSTRKIFIIIMSNTQEPVIIQSIIFPVSFTTFVMILRSSYSYYTVFSQVYQD